MAWKEKLKRLEKEVAEKREKDGSHENRKKDALIKKVQRAYDDLGIMPILESIRDEMWGAGKIQHEITSYGFEAELYFDYPDYIAGYTLTTGTSIAFDTWYPPKIDFTRESLVLKMFIGPESDTASLDIRFCHPDYDILHAKMHEFAEKYGSENISRFWGHDGNVSICQFVIGEDLAPCKEQLEDLLLQYCAIKSFLPREEIMLAKAKNAARALKGELPTEHINEEAVKALRESGLLKGV